LGDKILKKTRGCAEGKIKLKTVEGLSSQRNNNKKLRGKGRWRNWTGLLSILMFAWANLLFGGRGLQ